MKNEPHNTNMVPRLRTPTPEPGDKKDDEEEEKLDDESAMDDQSEDVYKLPPPEPLGVNALGEEESIRLPKIQMPLVPKNFMAKVSIKTAIYAQWIILCDLIVTLCSSLTRKPQTRQAFWLVTCNAGKMFAGAGGKLLKKMNNAFQLVWESWLRCMKSSNN